MIALLSRLNPINLIPPQYLLLVKVIGAIIIILIIFSSGCWVMHKIDEGNYQRAENERIAKEIEKAENLAKEQSEIDSKRTKELQDAHKKIADLRYCLVRGTCRLSIPTMCKGNSNSACVDDGATRTDLDIPTATSLVDITERCDKITIQLNATQDLIESWSK